MTDNESINESEREYMSFASNTTTGENDEVPDGASHDPNMRNSKLNVSKNRMQGGSLGFRRLAIHPVKSGFRGSKDHPIGADQDHDPTRHIARIARYFEGAKILPVEVAVAQKVSEMNNIGAMKETMFAQAKNGKSPFTFVGNMLAQEDAEKLNSENHDDDDMDEQFAQAGSDDDLASEWDATPEDFAGSDQKPGFPPPPKTDPDVPPEDVDAALKKANADRGGINPQHPNSKEINDNYDQYIASLKKVPETAKAIEKARIGNPEAIIGLAAVLLGGIGVAPQILAGLSLGSKREADRKNAENQRNYSLSEQKRIDEINRTKANLEASQGRYRMQDAIFDQEYRDKMRAASQKVADATDKVTERDRLRKASKDARAKELSDAKLMIRKMIFEATTSGNWNDKTQEQLTRMVYQIAWNHGRPDLPVWNPQFKEQIARYANSIRDEFSAEIEEAKRKSRKFQFSFENGRWSPEFPNRQGNDKRAEFKYEFDRQLAAFEREIDRPISDKEYKKLYDEAVYQYLVQGPRLPDSKIGTLPPAKEAGQTEPPPKK
jgi:hypothetical protein